MAKIIEDLLKKMEAYHIACWIIPGTIFRLVLILFIPKLVICEENLLYEIILCYFLGMITSRIGSTMIEPLLKKIKIIEIVDYSEYMLASKTDNKVDLLQVEANQYRTYISMQVLLICIYVYQVIIGIFSFKFQVVILLIILLIIFILSYKKQHDFIIKRIKSINQTTK